MSSQIGRLTPVLCAASLAAFAGRALGASSEDGGIRAEARAFASVGFGAEECARCRALAGGDGGDIKKPSGSIPFDEASGRRLANYPPHRVVDIENIRLDLSIDDMNSPVMAGVETITFAPIGWTLEELPLNARGMKITRVESPGRDASFTYDAETLRIRLTPAPARDERAQVVITYSVNNPPAGLVWTPESRFWPGRPAQIHTQGEPQTNSYWFPCHDFPNDRLTTELHVTVPAGYDVCANGRLVSRDRGVRSVKNKLGVSSMVPLETFHWLQDDRAGGDHVSYLVSMVVGKFDVVDVGSMSLPAPVYVPRGRGRDVPATFGRTAAMIEAMGSVLDEPYPWAKYSQTLVWNFGAGGMENTSATTLYDTAVLSRDALQDFDLDGLISHELGHQWFGDLITCKSWEHVWLNEGFATYMSALWAERRPGVEGGPAAYQASIRGTFDGIISSDRPEAPYAQAMVSKAYEHPWETFRRPANPYGKGASILHMLRVRLGDEVFFKGIATYVDRFKHKTAETSDLRKALEDVSGESLEQFFAQWCMRPGVPTLKVETAFDAAAGELRVDVEQVQNIDSDNPAFEFTLPIWIGGGGSEATWLKIDVRGRKASGSVTLAGAPSVVAVDPDMAVLAGLRIAQAPERWLAQLNSGPTFASRAQAARALGVLGTAGGKAALDDLFKLAMDRGAYAGLRTEAVRALAAAKDVDRVEVLAIAQLTPASVRAAAVEALGSLASGREDSDWQRFRGRASGVLADLAERDPSARTRAEAVSGLGKLKARDRVAVVIGACGADSQDDIVRQAGLGALADMGASDRLDTVIGLTREGTLSRTRAKAAETLGKLGSKAPDVALKRLTELLSDPEVRVRGAARQGLVDLGDPRGVAELSRAAERMGDADRADAKACLKRLRERLAGADGKSSN